MPAAHLSLSTCRSFEWVECASVTLNQHWQVLRADGSPIFPLFTVLLNLPKALLPFDWEWVIEGGIQFDFLTILFNNWTSMPLEQDKHWLFLVLQPIPDLTVETQKSNHNEWITCFLFYTAQHNQLFPHILCSKWSCGFLCAVLYSD